MYIGETGRSFKLRVGEHKKTAATIMKPENQQ